MFIYITMATKMAEVCLCCDIRGPLCVNSELENVGCKVYLIILRQVNNVAFIRFRNRYAASLSIRVKRRNSTDDSHLHDPGALIADVPWETCVSRKCLMPSPHFEEGSQDQVFVFSQESLVEWRDVIAFLLVIHQASPVWKSFHIQDIFLFGYVCALSSEKLDLWNAESESELEDEDSDEKLAKGPTSSISFRLLNMMDRVDAVAKNQSDVTVGNFEVGTSYDINLLL